jgi:4-hydroxybenzoate polyprenyltransferase
MKKVQPYIRLMRPHHYIKNLFIFLPLFFSGRMTERAFALRTLPGFLAFCLVSSMVYIYNDIMDIESDRKHSVKCGRPLASGAAKEKYARILAGVLLCVSIALQAAAGRAGPLSWLYLTAYLLINIAYSRRLKHVAVLDVAILAAGFLLRLAYGAALTGIAVSGWLFLTVTAMSFYMGLGKRRGELIRQKEIRQVLISYNQGFLEKSMKMCLTLTVAFYALWAAENGRPAAGGFRSGGLLWTVPLVLLICLKYSLDLEGDSDGDPVEVVLHDKILCALALLLALIVSLLLYF